MKMIFLCDTGINFEYYIYEYTCHCDRMFLRFLKERRAAGEGAESRRITPQEIYDEHSFVTYFLLRISMEDIEAIRQHFILLL